MNVYGSRQYDKGAYVGVVARMLNALDAGEPPVIHGDGSQAYDFVDVRDCAKANMLAMQAAITNRNYNVGTGVKTSIAELASRLSVLHPSKLQPRFESVNRPYVRNRIGSTKLAANELGFTAEISLAHGLLELLEGRSAHQGG